MEELPQLMTRTLLRSMGWTFFRLEGARTGCGQHRLPREIISSVKTLNTFLVAISRGEIIFSVKALWTPLAAISRGEPCLRQLGLCGLNDARRSETKPLLKFLEWGGGPKGSHANHMAGDAGVLAPSEGGGLFH